MTSIPSFSRSNIIHSLIETPKQTDPFLQILLHSRPLIEVFRSGAPLVVSNDEFLAILRRSLRVAPAELPTASLTFPETTTTRTAERKSVSL